MSQFCTKKINLQKNSIFRKHLSMSLIFESSVVGHAPAQGHHVSAASPHLHLPGDGQPHTRSLARLWQDRLSQAKSGTSGLSNKRCEMNASNEKYRKIIRSNLKKIIENERYRRYSQALSPNPLGPTPQTSPNKFQNPICPRGTGLTIKSTTTPPRNF